MDATAFRPSQLMYWGSYSRDAEYIFEYGDDAYMDPDKILKSYPDWKDTSYWPLHPDELRIDKKKTDKQANPRKKKGVIGAFCRLYTIQSAIETFLPDVYAPCDGKSDRYSYLAGTTSGGLVIYDDGLFAYSNHSTDPARGLDLNAFDLVRIHKFGDKDDRSKEDTPITKLPSYKAMIDFAVNLGDVKVEILKEKNQSALDDFEGEDEEKDWRKTLDLEKNGKLKNTMENAYKIVKNDKNLQNIACNRLSGFVEITGPIPWDHPDKIWRDTDDSHCQMYLSENYGEFSQRNYMIAIDKAADERAFHPIRDMFNSLPAWDGVERVDTLLIDYLGAEDNAYTRAVIRKILCAAYVRVFHPGAKFDYMVVINGPQGIGKSTLISKLGGEWYTDSLNVSDMNDKTAAEKLQGIWIMEIGEMQGTRKADVDAIKGFISRQVDEYRAAYGRYVGKYPRTSIMCGTTNSTTGFLRDTTGNRRFWPVLVSGQGRLSVWDMTEETRAQIWAEAVSLYVCGEDCYLDELTEKEAAKAQREAMEYDEREGKVIDYLETLLPDDWYNWPIENRVAFFQQDDGGDLDGQKPAGSLLRSQVCSTELWMECFGRSERTMTRQDAWDMANIMARIDGWERSGERIKIKGYGQQRPFLRAENGG